MSGLGPRFRVLLVSSAGSNLADGIAAVVVALLAARLTSDPVLVAAAAAATRLPWLLFSLPLGAMVDRVDRRRAMMLANGLRAMAVGVLAVAVASGWETLGLLYLVALVLGTAEVFYDLAARALMPAVLSEVAGRHGLERGNARLQVVELVSGNFLGGPVGGALFAVAAAAPFVLGSVGWALSAVVLLALRGGYGVERTDGDRPGLGREIAEGVRWLVRHPLLGPLVAVVALITLAEEAALAVLVLFSFQELGLDEVGFGLLSVAVGVGGLLGGLLAPRLVRRFSRGTVLVGGSAVASLAVPIMAAVPEPAVGFGCAALLGAGVTVFNVLVMSLRQALTPTRLFGRTQGAARMVLWGALPVGALLGGVVAGAIGLRGLYAVSGAVQLVGTVGIAVVMYRNRTLLAGIDDQRAVVSA